MPSGRIHDPVNAPNSPARTRDRLRLVFLVSTLRRTGPTNQLLNILRHLDRDAFDPVVVTLAQEPADTMKPDFDALQLPVRSLALSRLRALLDRRLRASIAQAVGAPLDGGCVVHSQGVRADGISARWLGGLARVATARNYPFDDYVMKYGRVAGRWLANAQLRALRRIPAVVACSATLADRLRPHGLDPIVIRNGVDTRRFRPASPAERVAARRALDVPPDARLVLCLGSLVPRKDPAGLVRAARGVADRRLVVALVGSGVESDACRRLAAGDSRIRLPGAVEDVGPWLAAADFLVSPSRSEGLPNAVLEAMACGLPVILSDIAPHAELLALAPGAGTLFPAGDGAALAAALAAAAGADDAPRGLGADAAETLFGAAAMSQRYQALYRRRAGAAA
jgi:glycosyltransferase involved in cell wall biosynthesis